MLTTEQLLDDGIISSIIYTKIFCLSEDFIKLVNTNLKVFHNIIGNINDKNSQVEVN